MQTFELTLPESLEEALELLAAAESVALGGGTATALLLKQNLIAPRRVVSLRRVGALRGVSRLPEGGLALGAGCTLSEVSRHPEIGAAYPSLGRCAAGVGNVRVRNVATLGGNLGHADPCQDLPPMLLALGAELVLRGRGGERRLPLDGFCTDYMQTALEPGELILRVELPAPRPGSRSTYIKFTPRSLDDYATVGVACRLDLDRDGGCTDVAVAFAGVGATPVLTRSPREHLVGRRPSAEGIAAAARAAAAETEPWDDLRGSAAYKRAMAEVWTRRALTELRRG